MNYTFRRAAIESIVLWSILFLLTIAAWLITATLLVTIVPLGVHMAISLGFAILLMHVVVHQGVHAVFRYLEGRKSDYFGEPVDLSLPER